MQPDTLERCREQLAHLCALVNVDGLLLDTGERKIAFSTARPHFCEGCAHPNCVELDTHAYGASEAYRWNGKYIYYCPLGLTFAASSVSGENGEMVGCATLGPLLMGDDAILGLAEPVPDARLQLVTPMEPGRVTHLAAVLAAVTSSSSGMPHSRAGSFVYEQEQLLKTIYSARDARDDGQARYPIEYEKRLHDLIAAHDKSGAQQLLNELLGHIYFANRFDLGTIKTRVMELVVLLSRATIDAGADIREIFLCNENYLQEIEKFDSIEDLSVWLTGIMHRFVNYSFVFGSIKHSDVVFKVMEYVRANYAHKFSLDDVADHVHLSRSYLSRIFKEEAGMSFVSCCNRVRVEKSKLFLLDKTASLASVASACGFEDQSYFTKVFKQETGMSPKKYRDGRGV